MATIFIFQTHCIISHQICFPPALVKIRENVSMDSLIQYHFPIQDRVLPVHAPQANFFDNSCSNMMKIHAKNMLELRQITKISRLRRRNFGKMFTSRISISGKCFGQTPPHPGVHPGDNRYLSHSRSL